jgi:hypothetical protein
LHVCVATVPALPRPRRNRDGHFWHGRFEALAMDKEHLAAALQVSLKAVRARLIARAPIGDGRARAPMCARMMG